MVTSKGERRRAALVEAAAQILVADGLEAVNHRAVAARAGVALGATTYYFADLAALRRAAVDSLVEADLARMAQVAADHCATAATTIRGAAEALTDVLTPAEHDQLVAWYDRYARAAREPLFATAARRANAAALEHVDTVLRSSGLADVLPGGVVLAVVDGAVIGALATGVSDPRARAADALAAVLAAAASAAPP